MAPWSISIISRMAIGKPKMNKTISPARWTASWKRAIRATTSFFRPPSAILYQGGSRILDLDISRPEPLVEIVNTFFDYKAPHIQEWEDAVRDFSDRIPELAAAVKKTIDEERKRNPSFVRS